MSDTARAAPRRLPPRRSMRLSWSDERFRGIVWQVLIVGIVVGVIWWLWQNTTENLRTRNIATGVIGSGDEANHAVGNLAALSTSLPPETVRASVPTAAPVGFPTSDFRSLGSAVNRGFPGGLPRQLGAWRTQ